MRQAIRLHDWTFNGMWPSIVTLSFSDPCCCSPKLLEQGGRSACFNVFQLKVNCLPQSLHH